METMTYNLLEEAWIPILRESGALEWIAPHQLTERHDEDPVVRIASPRADFNGVLTEFLIGLLQVARCPMDEDDWEDDLLEPPSPAQLAESFEGWRHGFELFGDGPRFMQDLDGVEGRMSQANEIKELLVEVPTGNTLKRNADHFNKRRELAALSPAATAAALMMLQTYAPSGGAGHRTSLRGGGPLTTLLLGETLWQTVWLNVLTFEQFEALHNLPLDEPTPEAILPWMVPTRLSESGSATLDTGPRDVHPMQALWGMPRRVSVSAPEQRGRCVVYDDYEGEVVEVYWTSPRGYNYDSRWRHPLSPYTQDTESGELACRHGNPGALQYRHWTQWAVQRDVEGALVAAPIFHATQARRRVLRDADFYTGRVWVFGYDFDNMKLRRWYDGRAPLVLVEPELQDVFADFAQRLVDAAANAFTTMRKALRRALYGKYGGKKWDVPKAVKSTAHLFENEQARFWQDTEAAFYDALARGVRLLESGDVDARRELELEWAKELRRAALEIFDSAVPQDATLVKDIKASVIARGELERFLSHRSKSVRKLLDLPD